MIEAVKIDPIVTPIKKLNILCFIALWFFAGFFFANARLLFW